MHQSPDKTRRARRLRADMTPSETLFWTRVRGRRLDGLKFRRQAAVAGLTVDFFCPELALVIELDGGVHRLREVEDAARDARLAEAGFTVMRVANNALADPNRIFEAIRQHARTR